MFLVDLQSYTTQTSFFFFLFFGFTVAKPNLPLKKIPNLPSFLFLFLFYYSFKVCHANTNCYLLFSFYLSLHLGRISHKKKKISVLILKWSMIGIVIGMYNLCSLEFFFFFFPISFCSFCLFLQLLI